MGRDWVGWEALGATLDENPEDPNVREIMPQEEYFFPKPLGSWPRAEPQSEGAKRQESLGSALGAPSEQPGTQGTQTRCGGTTPAQ